MKVVLLAGGLGTRISEESQYKPKPMIEIGGMPILWHIMKEYSYYGFNEFIICAGYKAGIYSDYSKDVIRPSAQECAQNGRARSTKMRWAVRAE